MSTSRSMRMPVPAQAIVRRKVIRTAAKSGVKMRVSIGARFPATLAFVSASQPETTIAPRAPEGSTHSSTSHSASTPIAPKVIIVSPMSTTPPSAISTQWMNSSPENLTNFKRFEVLFQRPPV